MYCRAVQTQVDSEGDGAPCGVFGAAVETYLRVYQRTFYLACENATLFAGFVLSFSNILSDWVLVARDIMTRRTVVQVEKGSCGLEMESLWWSGATVNRFDLS